MSVALICFVQFQAVEVQHLSILVLSGSLFQLVEQGPIPGVNYDPIAPAYPCQDQSQHQDVDINVHININYFKNTVLYMIK